MSEEQKPKLWGRVMTLMELESDWTTAYYVHGHVEPQDMVDAVKAQYGASYPVEKVERVYARNVPVGRGRPDMVMYWGQERGRGAYPITIISLEF